MTKKNPTKKNALPEPPANARAVGLKGQVFVLREEIAQLRKCDRQREGDIHRALYGVSVAQELATKAESRIASHIGSSVHHGSYELKKDIELLSGRCDSFTKLLNEQHDKLMEEIKDAEKRVSERIAGPLASFNGTVYGDELRETKAQLERTASNIRVQMHDSIASLSENVKHLQKLVLRQEKQIAELVGKNPAEPKAKVPVGSFTRLFNYLTGELEVQASIDDIGRVYSRHSSQSVDDSLRAVLEACSVRLMK